MTTTLFSVRRSCALAVVICLTCWSGPALAQRFPVCGDVDGNRTVSVTDAVQALRAAAGLPNDCTPAACDVDVNGSISVSDGVVILRKAAGLNVRDDCIPNDGAISSTVEHIVQRTQPLVTEALGVLVERRTTRADSDFPCRNGFDDGVYEVVVNDDGTIDGTFSGDGDVSGCRIDKYFFDGDVTNAGRNPDFEPLTINDQLGEESVDVSGALIGTVLEDGVKYSGVLDAAPTFNDDTSDYQVAAESLVVGGPGVLLDGSLRLIFTADSNVPDATEVQIFYDGSNLARVQVTHADGSVTNHKYDLFLGEFM